MIDSWKLRIRTAVDRNTGVVAVGLVVILLVGGFVTYSAYGQPTEKVETTTRTEITWRSVGQFTHHATVTNDTRVFDAGTKLSNRTQYYRKIAPVLNGSFVYNYSARSGSLAVQADLHRVVRSVSESGQGSEREYWRIQTTLDRTNTTVRPGESLRLSFEQNVSQIALQTERIQRQLGTTIGTTETYVVAELDIEGQRNGLAVDTNRTYRLPLTIESDLYRVNDTGPVIDQNERVIREENVVVVPPGPIWRYGGPLLSLFALAGLLGLAFGRYTGRIEVSDREREYLAFSSDRSEFDEWITEARVPTDRLDEVETRVETTSLAGLVDLAIDSDRRVLESVDGDLYLVFDGDVCYTYEPPTITDTDDDPLAPAVSAGDTGDDVAVESAGAPSETGEARGNEGDERRSHEEQPGAGEERSDGPETDSLIDRLQDNSTTSMTDGDDDKTEEPEREGERGADPGEAPQAEDELDADGSSDGDE